MRTSVRAWAVLVLAVVGLGMTSGCQNKRLSRERDDLYRQNQELQNELDRSREAMDQMMAQRQAAPPAPAPAPMPVAPVAMDSGFGNIPGVDVTETAQGTRVRVPGDVLFASGKADLSTGARSTLNRIASVINGQHAGKQIIVEGHTDTDPIRRSKWPSNQALSEARAQAVADYLAQQGVPRGRMQVVGYGSSMARETKAASRRVEILVAR